METGFTRLVEDDACHGFRIVEVKVDLSRGLDRRSVALAVSEYD